MNKSVFAISVVTCLLILAAVASLFPLSRSLSSVQPSQAYTGYQVIGPYKGNLRVEGSWIVPTANCTATPNSVSNISVIIDGISGEGDAMEIGTYQDCTSGVASYGAFVNIYPMIEYYGEHNGNISDLVIHPGDVVEAQGTWRNSVTKPINWNTNFVDETTGVLVDTDALTNSTFTPVLNSGALILSSDNHQLTALSPIYTGKLYTGVNTSDLTGPQRTDSSFGKTGNATGFTLVALRMPGTTLGPLLDRGYSFEMTVLPNVVSTTTSTSSSTSSTMTCTTSSTATSTCSSTTSMTTTSSTSSSPSTTTTVPQAKIPGSNTGGASGFTTATSVELVVAVVAVAVVATALLVVRKRRENH